MASNVHQGFDLLGRRLEITALQGETVSTRQTHIRQIMNRDFPVEDTFLTGSYARNTMIAPLAEADIDVFCVLAPSHYYNYAPAALLDKVRRVLLQTYTRTPDISRSGQAVSVRFNDFIIDVVVGVRRQGGGYLIPNSISRSWLSTDPKRHVAIFNDANRQHDGWLIPMIKMLKSWNRSHSSILRSFHLEVLALRAFEGVRISDFPSGARYFFDKARQLIRDPCLDPAGYGDDIGGYLRGGTKLNEAASRMERAFNTALRAEQAARYGDTGGAFDEWRKVFDEFPSLGWS